MAIRTNDRLNGIALCAGVGGLELGLHIAEPDYRTVCYVEREVFPAATLVARMADQTLDPAPIWDDVKTFNGRPWRGRVHIITGGYPCQPFSFCGQRRGQADPRHLWPNIRSIIEDTQPEWCFFENVEGHLTLGSADVCAQLREMDYCVKAGLFSALETGASQLRRRLFIVAHANKISLLQQHRDRNRTKRLEVPKRSWAARLTSRIRKGCPPLDDDVADLSNHGSDPNETNDFPLYAPPPSNFAAWSAVLARRPDLQPELFGLDHGVADRMDRSDAAGNGVVSLVAAYAWRTLKAAHYHD